MRIFVIFALVFSLCGCAGFGSKHQMSPKEQQKWLRGVEKR